MNKITQGAYTWINQVSVCKVFHTMLYGDWLHFLEKAGRKSKHRNLFSLNLYLISEQNRAAGYYPVINVH